MSSLVLCFSLRGLVSGLTLSSLRAPFLCIPPILDYAQWCRVLIDTQEHVFKHVGEGRCGSGWRWLLAAQAAVASLPSPVPHLCSCSEGSSLALLLSTAMPGCQQPGSPRHPELLCDISGARFSNAVMVPLCHSAGICGRSCI